MEVDVSVIAQRLVNLRKHLSDRLGTRLTLEDVAEKTGMPGYKMVRLEHGKGSWEPLIALLLFYRSHGYNLDWILHADNTNIPMMLSSGDDLLLISEMIMKVRNRMDDDYSELTSQLKRMGYSPLDGKRFAEPETELPLPTEFIL